MPSKTNQSLRIAGTALTSLTKTTYRAADSLATVAFKAMTTDHLGISQRMLSMPKMDFLNTLRYMFAVLVGGLVGAVVAGGLAFIGIAYVIPAVLGFAFQVFFK